MKTIVFAALGTLAWSLAKMVKKKFDERRSE